MKTLQKINEDWTTFLKKERIRFLVKNKLALIAPLEHMKIIDVNWRKSAYYSEKDLHTIVFQYKQYEFHFRKYDAGGSFSYGKDALSTSLSEDCVHTFAEIIKKFPFDTYIQSLKEEKREKLKEVLRSN